MDNKERWNAGVELFRTMEKGSLFVVDSEDDSTTHLMDVIQVDWATPRHRVVCAVRHGHQPARSHEVRYGIEKFLARNAVAYDAPEPEKSEAEKLWATCKSGLQFWTSGGVDRSCPWEVAEVNINCKTVTIFNPAADFYTLEVGRDWFIANATATRPKTEREVELEEQIGKLEIELGDSKRVNQVTGDFQSMSDDALMQSRLRVKELEEKLGIKKTAREICDLMNKMMARRDELRQEFQTACANLRKRIEE